MARAIDADAVKRRAWDIAEAWKDQGRDYEALLLESVVEQIVDTQPTLTPPNEWVSVEERRPQAGHDVIALLPCGDCAVVWWTGSVWRVRWDATQLDREPTHWMPLPAPPDRRPPEGEEDT